MISRPTAVYLAAVMLLTLWVGLVFFSGGFTATVWGTRVSSRDPLRPGLVLTALLAWYVWKRRDVYPFDADALVRMLTARARWIALAVAVLAYAAAIGFGTWSAGGADSYGYISQSELWAKGDLIQPDPLLDAPEWTHRRAVAPLGYTPHPSGAAIVPLYPAGLPILMAMFRALFGACGPFLVVPFFAGLAVVATYLLGELTGSRILALVAAIWLACSPTFLYIAVSPMTDVPVAAVFTLSLVFLLRPGMHNHVLGGIAAGLAIAIRFNLAPILALMALGLLAVERSRSSWKRAVIAAAMFAIAALPGAILAGAVQDLLHGSPWRSGYGNLDSLFNVANVVPNAIRYSSHLVRTQSPLILLALAAVAGIGIRWSPLKAPAVRFALILFVAGVWGAYLVYLQFEEWWYLRFLLPTFPVLIVLALVPVWGWLRDWRPALLVPAAWTAMLALIFFELSSARAGAAFTLFADEQRYAAVGAYVDRYLPSNAVFLSLQHSGSIRHYGRRYSVRYDLIDGDQLTDALNVLKARGYKPYILLDDWEQSAFRRHFRGTSNAETLAVGLIAHYPRAGGVNIYDPDAPPETNRDTIPTIALERCGLPGLSARR
ncbi:MAG: hypothetical protein WD690_06415 [Vicinamibacterales bacterium]